MNLFDANLTVLNKHKHTWKFAVVVTCLLLSHSLAKHTLLSFHRCLSVLDCSTYLQDEQEPALKMRKTLVRKRKDTSIILELMAKRGGFFTEVQSDPSFSALGVFVERGSGRN